MKRFGLIGAAGFVAPRHLRAISETGNDLMAACDPYDGVGVLDSWFPGASFFTEFERFDRHVEKMRLGGDPIDYFSICSPNYLHDAHVRFALRYGASAICEKPLVLNPWNLDALEEIQNNSPGKVYTILQLRLHPAIVALKEKLESDSGSGRKQVKLTYIASRGNWYYTSWKGETSKSGGIATNIGIHFFDMLMWLFGNCEQMEVHQLSHDRASGWLGLQNADVEWFLSINSDTLPDEAVKAGKKTYRSILIDGEEIEFSSGFEDLHNKSYEKILRNEGFGISEARPSIELVHQIRKAVLKPQSGRQHPLAGLPQSRHPFEGDGG
ncbi:MAG: gfo/Idh/MocA family oxidoreductase [Saprospirales bacterium]|nr:MAG: gfo/Idh/MocA family oxidoreductase [Saprospirales bacterium]